MIRFVRAKKQIQLINRHVSMNFFQVQSEIPALQPPVLFHIGPLPVTNSLMLIWVILFLTILLAQFIARNAKLKPGKFQNIFEILYEGMYGLVGQITNNKVITDKLFPLIAALFLFIGISNLITLIPGLTSFTINGVEIFRSPTTDFNTTFGLAFAMLILVQLESIRDWGIFGFLGRFVQIKQVYQGFRKGFGAGLLAFMNFLIGLLDIISELAKVVSLSMRLFGNMLAGSVLMVIIMAGFAYFLPALWMGMNILSGVVQALVFGSLIAAYYMTSLQPEEN